MVKVIGPALSLGASKSLGNLLTFQKRRGGTAVYLKNKPGGREPFTPSYKQRDQRAIIGLLTAQWQSFTQAVKDQWNEDAKTAGEVGSGYHYWLKKAQTNLLFYHGLAGYWSFNGPVGPTVPDLSGNGNVLTLKPSYPTNAPLSVDGQNPKFGKELTFDGIDDYATAEHSLSLEPVNFTIIGWVCARTLTAQKVIAAKIIYPTSGYYFSIEQSPNRRISYGFAGATGWHGAYSTTGLTLGKRHFLAWSQEGPTTKLYIDGELDYTRVWAEGIKYGGVSKLWVGAEAGLDSLWDGLIDELRLYNRVLTPGEIKKQYEMFRRAERK